MTPTAHTPIPETRLAAATGRSRLGFSLAGVLIATLLASCAAPKPPQQEEAAPPSVVVAPAPAIAAPMPELVSEADSPRAYRRDGAQHLYGKNRGRIFHGKLPPLMFAVGVLQVQLDNMGQVVGLHWARAPNHAPEVILEIERTVYAAAPFPAPVRMGGVTYTDIWLWDKSGNFQLDTLTEGQRGK